MRYLWDMPLTPRRLTASQLVRMYASGQRSFVASQLDGISLHGVDLHEVNLARSDLDGADLSAACLREANLNGASLIRANLCGSELGGAIFIDAVLSFALLIDADLSGSRLAGADLREANLSSADLREADLSGADLRDADLSGADLTEAILEGASLTKADLTDAKLRSSRLSGAYLNMTKLVRADLLDADLSSAYLCKAEFDEANLSRADLTRADLTETDFSGATLQYVDFTEADLSRTMLWGADLSGARLDRANFSEASLGRTVLVDVDLSSICEADPPVSHLGPCSVDFRSIVSSLRAVELKSFLIDAGMPWVFAEYNIDCARSLDPGMLFSMMRSTFISFGHPDESFARRLYKALHRSGVTTFFFPEHAVPGEKLHRVMRKGVNEHDRVILVCSKNSLDRKGVLNEIEEILTREAADGGASYLVPIRLDGYVFDGWNPPNADVAQAVRTRVVADFEGATKDDTKFDQALQRLLGALKKK